VSAVLSVPDLSPGDGTLTAALKYAAAGWYVGPVEAGTKDPGSILRSRWQRKTSRDPEVIVAWFAGTSHGVFLHVGRSGAVIPDVDTPDKLHPDIVRAVEECQPPYQSTRPDHPGRGHYIFAMPPGRDLGNGLGKLAGCWGEIRGKNGVILVAPTGHPDGGRYEWLRIGPVPILPGYLADQLDDALDAADAATDADVAAFLATRTSGSRPDLLDVHADAFRRAVEAGESRHHTMVGHLAGAMKEAAAGLLDAGLSADTLQGVFLTAVAAPPTGKKQGAARSGAVARNEWRGLLAWAVAQAKAADPNVVRKRVAEKVPEGLGWDGPSAGDVAPDNDQPADPTTSDEAHASWRPVDLGPYLRGEVKRAEPTIGLARADGLRLLYPGKEHTVVGEMESGKSWFAAACCAAELAKGNRVVYVHFEEADPADTIERLQALGVPNDAIAEHFTFVGPNEPVDAASLAVLLDPPPNLVVLDGVNEAMTLHGLKIREEDGAALFRRVLVKPCTAVGAAALACDHVVKDKEKRGREPIGSIHKGNGLTGSLIWLENAAPFGRGERGCSHVFVVKDRPGHLRRHGRPDKKTPGKTYLGSLIVDDTRERMPSLDLRFTEPRDDDDLTLEPDAVDVAGQDDDLVFAVASKLIAELGSHVTLRGLKAQVAGISDRRVDHAVERLVASGRLIERPGPRRARLFDLPATAAGPASVESP
jgi:hypothetical protein